MGKDADKAKRSLGRDVFDKAPKGKGSGAVRKILTSVPAAGGATARQIEVGVKLTPSNIKHLDNLRAELKRQGRGDFTRDELIRVAIALLSIGDF